MTHATPGPLYAAAADRDWETDASLPKAAVRHGCTDIGSQLLRPVGRDIDVRTGAGQLTNCVIFTLFRYGVVTERVRVNTSRVVVVLPNRPHLHPLSC